MHGRPPPQRRPTRCRYTSSLLLTGTLMLSAGLLLMFLCIPGWAWAALAGLTLIVLGYALICRAIR